MELFPAADEEQLNFIKRVIDDCDYYLLIVGGRYGSTDPEGVSYTEKEYDYAVEKSLKVIALLHEHPEKLTVEKTDIEAGVRERLKKFREKVSTNRLVKYWNTPEDLSGLVLLSMHKTIKGYPAVGWVRADRISTEQVLNEINQLRKENEKLKQDLAQATKLPPVAIDDLATLDENFTVWGTYFLQQTRSWQVTITWGQAFALIAPYLLQYPNDEIVKNVLTRDLFAMTNLYGTSQSLNDQVFRTIQIQLAAMNLLKTQYSQTTAGGWALFWSLTPQGEARLWELRTVRTQHSSTAMVAAKE